MLGLGLGIILNAHGLPIWTAPLLSAVVFAWFGGVPHGGHDQRWRVGCPDCFDRVPRECSPPGVRPLLPSAQGARVWAKTLAVHTLCDEAFAVNSGPDRNERSGARILWVNTLIYVSWILSVVLGYVLGASFLNDLKGVDFVMVAIFTVLAMDGYRANPDRVTALFVAVSAAMR